MMYPSRRSTSQGIARPKLLSRNGVWWHRVFAPGNDIVSADAVAEYLRTTETESETVFKPRRMSWRRATIEFGANEPFFIDRFEASALIVRQQIRTWISWLRIQGARTKRIAEVLDQSLQVYVFPSPPWGTAPFYIDLCKVLLGARKGVYQIDGQGFFSADGKTCLIRDYCMFGPRKFWWLSR